MLGFPEGTLRIVPSDDSFRLQAEPVADAIAEDRAAGLTPFAISAVAGSTNTGSIDDVPALADLAEREGLWLHVDAAYGAAARLSTREAHKLPGLERADSLTVDPHKWLFQPYDIGGLLVKRREDLLRTFHKEPEYYAVWGPEERPLHWYQYSLEGTRRFRALKLWLSWKHLGSDGFARLIERNVDLAEHLASRAGAIWASRSITPELAVVCLRHGTAPDSDPAVTDELQRRLQRALEVSGVGWLSTTTLHGRDLAPRRRDQLPVDGGRRRPDPGHARRRLRRHPRRPRRLISSRGRPRSPRRTGSREGGSRFPAGMPARAHEPSPASST